MIIHRIDKRNVIVAIPAKAVGETESIYNKKELYMNIS
jgi:hypothetical protein